jgi:peptidyl-prolyl cis-trans isomerase A (cyclophilin A)
VRKHAQQNKKTSRMTLSSAIILLFGLLITVMIMTLSFHIYWKYHGVISVASPIKLRGFISNAGSSNGSISNIPNSLITMKKVELVTEMKNKLYNVSFIINIDGSQKEEVIIEVNSTWAPLGATRFKELMEVKFFEGNRFFRVIKGFMVQFGINGNPETQEVWKKHSTAIRDDPPLRSNERGTISFACSGPHTRQTQLFINIASKGNGYLDAQGFAPFGRVIWGMEVIDRIYQGYGEGGKGDGLDGKGPSQGRIQREGNKYLLKYFPKLSYIEDTKFMP